MTCMHSCAGNSAHQIYYVLPYISWSLGWSHWTMDRREVYHVQDKAVKSNIPFCPFLSELISHIFQKGQWSSCRNMRVAIGLGP